MNACACMGPPGNCPCIRAARGEKVEITETYIGPELFAILSDEDKTTINELKQKAFALWFCAKKEKTNELPRD